MNESPVLLLELLRITENQDGEVNLLINNEWLKTKELSSRNEKIAINSLFTLIRGQLSKDLKNTPEEITVPVSPNNYIMNISISLENNNSYKVITKFGKKVDSTLSLVSCLKHALKVLINVENNIYKD